MKEILIKLPLDSIISNEKIREYLLKWRPENNKSDFLSTLGYNENNWETLIIDIREQILPLVAKLTNSDIYGDRYIIYGELLGPNGHKLSIASVWMKERYTEIFKFITLFPDKRNII